MSKPSTGSAPPAGAPKKGISSRLLTMKFMQRGTAQKASKPGAGTDSKTARKQSRQDINVLQEALREEERKKEEAMRKHDEITGVKDDGETRWELAIVPPARATANLNVRIIGEQALGDDSESEESSEDDEEEEEVVSAGFGRLSFGNFNKEIEKLNGAQASDSEAEEDEEEKPKKEVSLKHLTSISGGLSGKPVGQKSKDDRACFTCGGRGHLSMDCPKRQLKTLKRMRSNGDFLTIRDESNSKRRKSRP